MRLLSKILDFPFLGGKAKEEPKAQYYNNTAPWVGDFSGAETPYNLGYPIDIEPDRLALSMHAWELFLKTDIAQNAVRKYCLWIIGSGLKLQSDPQTESPLKAQFVEETERNFRLYADLPNSTYNENQSLHAYAPEVLKTALMSGDVLCVLRLVKGQLKLQAIDGTFVCDPVGTESQTEAAKRGNTICNGVEKNKQGKHVAFYVQNADYTYTRVKATGANGVKQAWLFYGLKYKLNDDRGISLFTAVMESLAGLSRYKKATIGKAEENAKVAYTIEHSQFSDGENPMTNNLRQSFGKGKGVAPETVSAESAATKIAQTTEKQVYNMPIGSKLIKHANAADPDFEKFHTPNVEIIYATLGMPPEVALDKFGGSYSGSRAAIQGWDFKMNVDRKLIMSDQYYTPFYNFWVDAQVLIGKLDNPDYLKALQNNDYMTLAVWRKCRFIGQSAPHIDPVKEVTAERMKLGKTFENTPLTTAEQSCEALNSGDFSTIINITKNEKDISTDFIPTVDSSGSGTN